MITIFALAGIGEVTPGSDLPTLIIDAARDEQTLADGDLVVVTSKIISKAEDRSAPATERRRLIDDETVRTVARRGETAIVRDRRGLTLAAGGIDNSNVSPDRVLLLPRDPDASAERLRAELVRRTGLQLGVIISDTAGRAWRVGQTDQAVGAAGVVVTRRYAGEHDAYGNELRITEMALADELAAAADLVKGKVHGRPVAVVRGLASLVRPAAGSARDLQRPTEQDLFAFGSHEAVLAAVLAATGLTHRYEELVRLPAAERTARLLDDADLPGPAAGLVRALLAVDLAVVSSALEARGPHSDRG
jgi:coenzyme F420-0:L-glutamate ligase/coenzyme F420-1:gamma-L-glutamate ligase